MKHLFTIISALIIFSYGFAQSIGPQLVATAGYDAQKSTLQLSWSVGEVVIPTLEDNKMILTQGFHQSGWVITSIQWSPEPLSISFFPNPTSNDLHIRHDYVGKLSLEIRNIQGVPIRTVDRIEQQHYVEVSGLTPGSYLLLFYDKEGSLLHSQIILKQ